MLFYTSCSFVYVSESSLITVKEFLLIIRIKKESGAVETNGSKMSRLLQYQCDWSNLDRDKRGQGSVGEVSGPRCRNPCQGTYLEQLIGIWWRFLSSFLHPPIVSFHSETWFQFDYLWHDFDKVNHFKNVSVGQEEFFLQNHINNYK